MKARFKVFSEFIKGITIAFDDKGGCTIICDLKKYVLLKTNVKPWHSVKTKQQYLMKMYFAEVLEKHTIHKNIQRIKGYELLGKRAYHADQLFIICDAQEMVEKTTGEMTHQITMFSKQNYRTSKIMIGEVQL